MPWLWYHWEYLQITGFNGTIMGGQMVTGSNALGREKGALVLEAC